MPAQSFPFIHCANCENRHRANKAYYYDSQWLCRGCYGDVSYGPYSRENLEVLADTARALRAFPGHGFTSDHLMRLVLRTDAETTGANFVRMVASYYAWDNARNPNQAPRVLRRIVTEAPVPVEDDPIVVAPSTVPHAEVCEDPTECF